MPTAKLTDRLVTSLIANPPKVRTDHFDVLVPGLSLRVFPSGQASWNLVYRLHGSRKLIRDRIEKCPLMGLADARQAAKARLEVIQLGRDPRQEQQRKRAEEARRREQTFGAMADAYNAAHLSGLRRGYESWAAIENDLLPEWKDTPNRDITRGDIMRILDRIAVEKGPYARNRRLSLIRHMMNWALSRDLVAFNPAARLPMLEEIERDRALADGELLEVWRAAAKLSASACNLVRMWILTGQRRSEISDMPWSEVNMTDELAIIDKSRMKGRRAHLLPFAPQAMEILRIQESAGRRTFVFFSPDRKDTPIGGFDDLKADLDRAILEARQAIDPNAEAMKPWRLHDLRRTFKSGLSRLRIDKEIRERCIAHTQPKLERTYDTHDFADEKRHAFTAWANFVTSLISPSAGNVTPLRRADSLATA